MSKPVPGPGDILQALEHVRDVSSDLAKRHTQAAADAAERNRLAQRREEAALRAAEEALQSGIDQANRNLAQAIEATRELTRRRTARLRQAQLAVRKTAAQKAESEEGRRKFELQREMLRATRERDAGLAEAKAAFDTFNTSLDAQQNRLALLEQTARTLLATFGSTITKALDTTHDPTPTPTLTHTTNADESELASRLTQSLDTIETELSRFRRKPLPALSRAWPVTLILVLSPAAIIPILEYRAVASPTWQQLVAASLALASLAAILHFIGRQLALPAARSLVHHIGSARSLLHAARERSAESHRQAAARLEAAFTAISERCQSSWNSLAEWLEQHRGTQPAQVDARANRAIARNDASLESRIARLQTAHQASINALHAEHQRRVADIRHQTSRTLEATASDHARTSRELAAAWTRDALPQLHELEAFRRHTLETPDRLAPLPPNPWSPPPSPAQSVAFGQLEVSPGLLLPLPPDIPDPTPIPNPWALPLLLRFPRQGSLLIEADTPFRNLALATLNQVVCRLLAGSPPGRVAFTVFDPVGLGQSFSSLTHLADEADHLIHGRIWTQSAQLEEKLADLNDHLEKVIQMYLRSDYPTIAEYNEQAGNIAEKYRFLVLADFPAGFSDLALRRLQAIASAGARCGVFLLVHHNPAHPLPHDFPIASLRQSAVWVRLTPPATPTAPNPATLIQNRTLPGTRVTLDTAPDPDALTAFIHQVAVANRDANRVEVPFAHIAPDDTNLWSHDTASEIRVPIGRTGATKFQFLALGKGTRQHALIAGKTGSGKSTLFHVLITNLALWCRPDQIEFYLVDFKKGVEFKCYATHRLPHARVVAIESDRDFGLSVLQRLDDELRRRGECFRNAQVQDLAAYRRSPNPLPMPRILLLVDEFQEFFVEEDRIAQNASALLDRIVRQGRAFGIHVILGSQTLGGAYTVARSTLGQMAVRIALQCNEADAFLIMDEENPAPRLLSRPGEAIYNDAAGARTGNSPFQIVWLPDDVRDAALRRVRAHADLTAPDHPGPMVFEGDAPADVRDNTALHHTLLATPTSPPASARTWLGAPNSIKAPTEVSFSRRSADHLLAVGQRDDALLAMAGIALAALAAQFPHGSAEFIVLDGSAPEARDHAWLQAIAARLPHPVTIARPADTPAVIQKLADTLHARTAANTPATPTATFLIIHALQQFRALRQDDSFGFASPDTPPATGALFQELLSDGPPQGIHVIASCDTYANVMRSVGRKGLSEFGYRVLYQMSANDSASLVDTPAASRLGLHRALLYLDREGHTEVFRPYALPDPQTLHPQPQPS